MYIGKICNRNVVSADANTNVVEAARMMRHNHVGSIIVTHDGDKGTRPVGIITDRDLVIEIMAEEIDPGTVTVGDVMTRYPLAAYEDDEPYVVLEAMRNKGVRRIPVIDSDGMLVGVLAVDDILQMISRELGNMMTLVQREYDTEVHLRRVI